MGGVIRAVDGRTEVLYALWMGGVIRTVDGRCYTRCGWEVLYALWMGGVSLQFTPLFHAR